MTACAYSIIILFFSFWPPATPTTAATMNYSVLMTGAVLVFSVVYYFLYARKMYTGPVLENEIELRPGESRGSTSRIEQV